MLALRECLWIVFVRVGDEVEDGVVEVVSWEKRESVEECLLLDGDGNGVFFLGGGDGSGLCARDAAGMRSIAACRWLSDSLKSGTFVIEDRGSVRAFWSRQSAR